MFDPITELLAVEELPVASTVESVVPAVDVCAGAEQPDNAIPTATNAVSRTLERALRRIEIVMGSFSLGDGCGGIAPE